MGGDGVMGVGVPVAVLVDVVLQLLGAGEDVRVEIGAVLGNLPPVGVAVVVVCAVAIGVDAVVPLVERAGEHIVFGVVAVLADGPAVPIGVDGLGRAHVKRHRQAKCQGDRR